MDATNLAFFFFFLLLKTLFKEVLKGWKGANHFGSPTLRTEFQFNFHNLDQIIRDTKAVRIYKHLTK